MTPYLILLWGTLGGKSIAVFGRTDVNLGLHTDRYSLLLRCWSQGPWLQLLLRKLSSGIRMVGDTTCLLWKANVISRLSQ